MKKIPFDLERARKGEAFRLHPDDVSDTFYIGEFEGLIFYWWDNGIVRTWDRGKVHASWYHLITEEPKKERWIILPVCTIEFTSKNAATDYQDAQFFDVATKIVKISDDE